MFYSDYLRDGGNAIYLKTYGRAVAEHIHINIDTSKMRHNLQMSGGMELSQYSRIMKKEN